MEATMTKATGAGTEAAFDNAQPNYPQLGDLAQAYIDAQRLASTVLDGLQTHYANPDALFLALASILPPTLDPEALAAVRGFMRTTQKRSAA